jgi:hypothetical protein
VRGVWGQSYAAVRQRVDDAAACEYSSRSVRAGATKVALLLQKTRRQQQTIIFRAVFHETR